MTLEAVKTSAESAATVARKTANTVVKALGRVFEYMGTVLSATAKKIAEWVNVFLKNLPTYCQIAKDYTQLGFKCIKDYASSGFTYIKNNRNAVAVGSGVTIGVAALAWGINNLFGTKSEEN